MLTHHPLPCDSRPQSILLVDEPSIIRESISEALRAQGYQVETISSGKESLDRCRIQQPDLLIIEHSLSDISGIDLLRSLRNQSETEDVKVILLTDFPTRDMIFRAARLGVCSILIKTKLTMDMLTARVSSAWNQKQVAALVSAQTSNYTSPTTEYEAPIHAKTSKVSELQYNINEAASSLTELRPFATRSEIKEILDQNIELKGLSPIVSKVMQLTGNQSCSINDVARAIKQDQAISLKVLKLANSSVYSRGEPVESIDKAVMRIGLSRIRKAVMNISVIDQFSRADHIHINAGYFWEHSIATGLIASELSRELGGGEQEVDMAFTMGLLHDVGRMVFIDIFGEQYTNVLHTAKRLMLPLEQVESRMLTTNHADAMDRILRAWKFPNELINPIVFHHLSVGNMRRMSPKTLRESAILGLANRLAHALCIGSSGNPSIYPIKQFIDALKIKPRVIKAIEKKIPDQAADMKLALMSKSDLSWQNLVDTVRQSIHASINPMFVSATPEIDPVRMYFNRICDFDEDSPPNLAIVQLENTNQRVMLSEKIKSIEAEYECKELPIMIFSPKANIRLEESVMRGRNVAMLSMPIMIDQIISALNNIFPESESDN